MSLASHGEMINLVSAGLQFVSEIEMNKGVFAAWCMSVCVIRSMKTEVF